MLFFFLKNIDITLLLGRIDVGSLSYDCSAEQIGKQIGLNRFAVSKRLSRSRKKLRELLNDLDISL